MTELVMNAMVIQTFVLHYSGLAVSLRCFGEVYNTISFHLFAKGGLLRTKNAHTKHNTWVLKSGRVKRRVRGARRKLVFGQIFLHFFSILVNIRLCCELAGTGWL